MLTDKPFIGQIVRLKSGGPKMLVVDFAPALGTWRVTTAWYARDGKEQELVLPAGCFMEAPLLF